MSRSLQNKVAAEQRHKETKFSSVNQAMALLYETTSGEKLFARKQAAVKKTTLLTRRQRNLHTGTVSRDKNETFSLFVAEHWALVVFLN